MSGGTSSFAARLAAPGMNRRCFLAASAGTLAGAVSAPMQAAGFQAARRYTRTAFGRIAHVERGSGPAALFGFPLYGFHWRGGVLDRWLGACQGSKPLWPEEHPDVIAEEARRLWAAQGDQA
ncbi:hypothetical protein ACFPME_03255 [Rhodanobacter umsongensis]|uniref:Uncharacterized protein n=1 Tax=Rhodanobacter umsongensis TaxID=633153 RepID=A0ABW0JI87_9GAMM